LPRPVIFLYLACSRCWAVHDLARVCALTPAWRRESVIPIPGRCW
jgi:hypothetical protein